MAAEPSKTEIQTLFKRLRAVPTNKVREQEAKVLALAERDSPGSPRAQGRKRGGRGLFSWCQRPASTRGP